MMDDETSRTSLGSTASRLTDDLCRSEKVRLETQLQDAQSELYQLRRVMPFLESTSPDNPSVTFRTIATECADLRDERDRLRKQIDELQASTREELQHRDDLVTELRRELSESREERDMYRRKCEQYERELSDEESRLYQEGMDAHLNSRQQIPPTQIRSETPNSVRRPVESSAFVDRGARPTNNRRVNFVDERAAKDPLVRELYDRMDEEDSEISSVASHSRVQNQRPGYTFNYEANITVTDPPNTSQANADASNLDAANVEEYVNVLKNYRVNVRALYDQMKSTAQFFVDILRRLGYENDPQIQLMINKINEINLNMQDAKNLSKKVLEETRQIGHRFAELNRTFERANQTPNASKNNTHDRSGSSSSSSSKDFEEMLKHKDKFIVQLRNEKNELANECQKLQSDCNELQRLTAGLEQRLEESKGKENYFLGELDNRKQIIDSLALQIQQKVSLALQFQQELSNKNDQIAHLKQRLNDIVRSNMTTGNMLNAKVKDGATKAGYVLNVGR